MLVDHKYNIYIFSEGVLRTSSEPYDARNLENITSHLTNHCIQVHHNKTVNLYLEGKQNRSLPKKQYGAEQPRKSLNSTI